MVRDNPLGSILGSLLERPRQYLRPSSRRKVEALCADLLAEKTEVAQLYQNRSVHEQKSVDVAWDLLMEPQYNALRACIYSNRTELERFRQLVVNSVMATDLADKELGLLRKNRWDKAFHNEFEVAAEYNDELLSQADVNRKATIVIEHLIQASDVSHTMQHWK